MKYLVVITLFVIYGHCGALDIGKLLQSVKPIINHLDCVMTRFGNEADNIRCEDSGWRTCICQSQDDAKRIIKNCLDACVQGSKNQKAALRKLVDSVDMFSKFCGKVGNKQKAKEE